MRIVRKDILAAALALAVVACGQRAEQGETKSQALRKTTRSVRIGMAELHRMGGVPPGWRFTPPAGDVDAGRRTFVEQRCHTCHRVDGEPFSTSPTVGAGPELTGMGGHHPPGYFAESILSPDAVLVEGPGYIGADGRSVMPAYPHMTVAQLADLVAYISSLRAGGSAHVMASMQRPPTEVPPPPPQPASIFFVQTYDIQPGALAKFEEWFANEGKAAFLAVDGVLGLETWVDTAKDGPAVSTVLAFRDQGALTRFLDDPNTDVLGRKFDDFIGPHGHRVFRTPPVYRAPTLSTP
jgi:mono/diheme cytochrome c family protein